MMLPRRTVLLGGTGLIISPTAEAHQADAPVVITMRSDAEGSHVGFDPVGLLIQPGQMLRFLCEANYHTTAAYHPENGSHSLRIPREARPWASDVLQPGEHFDVRLFVPGVYDYFCAPHEEAGMVGRIIVGQPTGPGSLPFDWFKGRPEASEWLAVPPAAQAAFPSVADIMRKRQVPAKISGTSS
jgi:plastocyanin